MSLLNRISLIVGALCSLAMGAVFGRQVAINVSLTPLEVDHLGIDSLDADSGAIAFKNAAVKFGSDDRHFVINSTTQTDVAYGVVLNDQVDSGEEGVIKKNVAVFGLYRGSMPCVSDGTTTIAAGDRITSSATVAGQFRKMPTTSGQTYVDYGRARRAVAATAGEPISLVHKVPATVTNP